MNENAIFEICLEDYTQPRYKSEIRPYYGTENEIHALMGHLRNSTTGAAVRYNETIEAVEFYGLDNDVTHTVAGQTLPVLKPVEEIVRVSTQLRERHWKYTTHDGSVFPCYASKIDVCHSLIHTDTGFERCLRVTFYNLSVSLPRFGWVSYRHNFKGFPSMVVTDGDMVSLALFASQAHYEIDEQDMAMADTMDTSKIDLSVAVADILGEG